jgi:NADH dehydrogenase FAD-containing subunit
MLNPEVNEMPDSRDPLRVVVAGAGVAGLEAVLTLAERAGEMLDVTLVADRHDFVPARTRSASCSDWDVRLAFRSTTSPSMPG